MHGDISDPAKAVLSKDDYESYSTTRRGQLFSTALRGDLVSKTFLFIGFSFSDPNLDYILSRIRVLLEGNRREHYCLMRRIQRPDFKKKADFQYASTKQELQIKDLRRYGIIVILLDSFKDFTNALRDLERAYRSRQVFISGSANSYDPMQEDHAHRFLALLGKSLADHGLNVITGFGLGIGPHVINGVLDALGKEGTNNLSDRLTLRPFPYAIQDPKQRRARWTSYRNEMISKAGIAIFVFGNKRNTSGEIVLADGMMEEFEIALNAGLVVIPVGGTGYVAQQLHQKVSERIDQYFPKVVGLKSAFAALIKKGNSQEMVSRVMKVILMVSPK